MGSTLQLLPLSPVIRDWFHPFNISGAATGLDCLKGCNRKPRPGNVADFECLEGFLTGHLPGVVLGSSQPYCRTITAFLTSWYVIPRPDHRPITILGSQAGECLLFLINLHKCHTVYFNGIQLVGINKLVNP